MRSRILAAVVAVLFAVPGLAQTSSGTREVVWRAQLGGGSAVTIDTVTALPALISRLNNDWQFVETSKWYWIGYTDDMYSIAAHGETAIPLLLNFIQTTSSVKNKYGAVCCLHLIGIKSIVAGRTYEQFQSVAARQALRSLLTQDDLREWIIELLIRDPWQSDVPYLFAALEKGGADEWALVNSLVRYQVANLPIQQPIPFDIGTETIKVPALKRQLDDMQAINLQAQQIVGRIRALQPVYITIRDSVERGVLWGSMIRSFGKKLIIRNFLSQMTEVNYLQLGSRLHYFIDENGLTICATPTARKRLLAWWQAQQPAFRQQFQANAAKKRSL